MEKQDETLLPERWRNKLFRYMAGGYSGCICKPALLIVTGDGRVRLINDNYGAGSLSAAEWCERGNHTIEERHRRERLNVRAALEAELVNHTLTGVQWDHEFEEFDISTKEKVTETCKTICQVHKDVYFGATLADVLRDEGYEGYGFICSDCGEFIEDTDYESFKQCVDSEAYHGIGGLAVAHTRIVCDDCRRACECPFCFDLNLPTKQEQESGHACDHMNYQTEFFYKFVGCCEYCADMFVYNHDATFNDNATGFPKPSEPKKMERLTFPISKILSNLDGADAKKFNKDFAESARKYADWKRTEEGWTDERIRETISHQILEDIVETCETVPVKFIEGLLRNALVPIVKAYWRSEDPQCEEENLDEYWKELLQ